MGSVTENARVKDLSINKLSITTHSDAVPAQCITHSEGRARERPDVLQTTANQLSLFQLLNGLLEALNY